jgi:hypothetical protein
MLRLSLATLGLFAGLGIAEVGLRFGALSGGNQLLFPGVDLYPRDLYVEMQGMSFPNPGWTGTIRSLDYDVAVQFTHWGTRGAREPDPTKKRWIAVGDSYTLALQVPEHQTFCARLEASLRTEVINAGVDGYSTWKETIRLAQLAADFPPEGAIVGFFVGNDLYDNLRNVGGRTSAQPGPSPRPGGAALRPQRSPPPVRLSPVEQWLHDHSILYAHWQVLARQREVSAAKNPRDRHFLDELSYFGPEAAEHVEHDIERTAAAFADLRATADRLGIGPVILVVIPPAFGLDPEVARRTLATFGLPGEPDVDAASDAVVRAARLSGLYPCDLRPALRAALAAGDNPYFLFDAHLDASGHAVVAEVIAHCIAENAAIPASTAGPG